MRGTGEDKEGGGKSRKQQSPDLPEIEHPIVVERLQVVDHGAEETDDSGAGPLVPLKEGGVEEQPEQQAKQKGDLEKEQRVHPAAGRVG